MCFLPHPHSISLPNSITLATISTQVTMADFHSHYSHLTENSILAMNITSQMSSSMQRNTLQPTQFSPIICQDDHVYYHEIPLQSLLLQHEEAASILDTDNELPPIAAQELESNNGDPDNLVVVPLKEKKQKTDYKIAREGQETRKKRRDDLMKKVKIKEDKMKDETQSEYIHVRARRGQATDSHSLAERVRREKISERMTILQSLVPGCDKITGKTQVLDEIINYVQSLQNQVEVMMEKLETLNDPLSVDFQVNPAVGSLRDEVYSPGASLISLLQTISSENQMVHFPFPYHQEEQNNHGLASLDNGMIPTWDTIDQHQLHNSIRF